VTELLAAQRSAEYHCPMSCKTCSVTTRGCIGFGSFFLGGVLGVVDYGFLLIGTVMYASRYKNTPIRTMMFWIQIMFVIMSVMDLGLVLRWNKAIGIPDWLFTLGDDAFSEVLVSLGRMPVLVLAAQLCPASIEGTLFATIMSISNLGPQAHTYKNPCCPSLK